MSRSAKEWSSPQNALAFLNVADNLPHRSEGESVLIDHLPENTNNFGFRNWKWKINQADKGKSTGHRRSSSSRRISTDAQLQQNTLLMIRELRLQNTI